MREIKFRVWDSKSKKMSLPFDVKKDWGDWLIDFDEYSADGASEEMEWLQYTGLKDKNGVEIYEGDIIKFDDLDVDVRVNRKNKVWDAALVEWGDFEMRFGARTYRGLMQFYHNYTEVIGNIYENPELLK